MVFNAAITNNDDHPRNHAVLHTAKGWRLAPAYDLVPAPVISKERRDLALTIGRFGRSASVYNLLSQADSFGLGVDDARRHIDALVAALRDWKAAFTGMGVSRKDIEYIEPAFLPECFFFETPPQAP